MYIPSYPLRVLNNGADMHPAFQNLGFIQVLENLESPGILFWHFPGLESCGKRLLVLESAENLLKSSKKKKNEMYGRE